MNLHHFSRIFSNKCPKCGVGPFFIKDWSYTKGFDHMHSQCSNCGQRFVPEPGFYQGALYVSYSFYVAFTIAYFVGYNYFFDMNIEYFLFSIILILILLTPWFYRLARRTWLSIFIKRD